MKTVKINVEVEVDEIIDELDSADLDDIAKQAGYFPKDNCIDEAIVLLRENNQIGASNHLDRIYNPKFASVSECRKAYNEAMGRD